MEVGDGCTETTLLIEFKPRDLTTTSVRAHSLPRVPADHHPLSSSSSKFNVTDEVEEEDILDPLRAASGGAVLRCDVSDNAPNAFEPEVSSSNSIDLLAKEWTTFKKFLVQRFPTSKEVSVSSIADVTIRSHTEYGKSPITPPDELDDDSQGLLADEDFRIITQQECISRLMEMKTEITQAWHAGDHIKSLKLSVKVARILRDTAVLQFYPTLFSLVTEILDALGALVWERIKLKAEFSDDGVQMRSLPENFQASDICSGAKETCHNWFCKIGSIRELLPRIYLEIAILPCWCFLREDVTDVLERLVAMMRGLGNPLASAYCHLYLAYCAQKLAPREKGYIVSCIRNINVTMVSLVSSLKESTNEKSCMRNQAIIRLIEPAVEYIMKCIFKDSNQKPQVSNVLDEFGLGWSQPAESVKSSFVSVILHYMVKELPPEVVTSDAVRILDLIERSCDTSFDQSMNLRLLGVRIYENDSNMHIATAVLERIIQVLKQFQDLNAYLNVVDGYIDIFLQNEMKDKVELLLEGVAERAANKWMIDSEMDIFRSVFLKILSHAKSLEYVLKLNHFVEILDITHGSSRNIINIRILEMATRYGHISCPATIQFLFEVCQVLHEGLASSNLQDCDNQPIQNLLSRFVRMVDYGTGLERHLAFLVECRGAFASADELKDTLVHQGNCLAIKALTESKRQLSFMRSCLAFCETTIPSVSTPVKQFILYLETAEVALSCGLVGHSDELLDSAMNCLQSLVSFSDLQLPDTDRFMSMIQKLCSILIMVPGHRDHGVGYILKNIISLVKSQPRWMTTRFKVKALCAAISLLATLAQNKAPYQAPGLKEILDLDLLYLDDPFYHEKLALECANIIEYLVHAIKQEASLVVRGSLALEACNCIGSFLQMNASVLPVCNELMEIAKSSLKPQHHHVLSTSEFLSKAVAIC